MVLMTLTDDVRNELRRMATHVECFNAMLHDMLIEASCLASLPVNEYDRIHGWYRNWIVDNELPLIHAKVDGGRSQCMAITAYNRPHRAYKVMYHNGKSVLAAWVKEENIELS